MHTYSVIKINMLVVIGIDHIDLIYVIGQCCRHGFRYLDPDPPTLLTELDQTVNKKFHKLNKALTTLVSMI